MTRGRPSSLWGKPAPPPDVKPTWTSYELAEYLDLPPTTVQRWCKAWFGELGKGHNVGRGQGYKIPWQYVYQARLHLKLWDAGQRERIRPVLTTDPRDWVVEVDGQVSVHYTKEEAVERVSAVPVQQATLVYVGEFPERIQ